MRQGRSLVELAAELERQKGAKRDYVANTRALNFTAPAKDEMRLEVRGTGEPQAVTRHAATQIATRLGIPQKYFDRMAAEHPRLLEQNVNGWFQAKPERRMVRTMDGNTRAFLSDRYRRLDNAELAEAVLPVLLEGQAGVEIVSCEVTETRLYLKYVTSRLTGEVRPGDVVRAGGMVTNSEVGSGSLKVQPFVERLVCTNGMVVPDMGQKRYHVGRHIEGEAEAVELYSDRTLEADDRALWLKVQDTVRATLTGAGFDKILGRLREAAGQRIEGDPVKSVEVLANKLTLNETERGGVLRHLIAGGDLTAYGLVQAVTETSKDADSYDRATELEAAGGAILTLPPVAWREVAMAA